MSSLAELPFGIADDTDYDYEDRRKEQLDQLDYKMVTFSLGGKDYGIDIMRVKEISKATRFTYVPNAAPYVRGVYNLRGDIISIIDLRIMFNIPITKPEKTDALETDEDTEEMIILRLENGGTIGVIVDAIDKVVSISSKNIQPPHPIFGDINIQFISGIVENDGRLYIILDVDKVFLSQQKSQEDAETRPAASVPAFHAAVQPEQELELTFIADGLAAFRQFFVSGLNKTWVKRRLEEWIESRKTQGKDYQLKDAAEADDFLRGFSSPYSGTLWGTEYLEGIKAMLPATVSNVVNVWNIGCGAGYEAFSLACLLKEKYTGKRVKVWAQDKNLIEISTAPSLVVSPGNIPGYYEPFLSDRTGNSQFNSEIKEMIFFEYHDIVHNNHVPTMDIIVARDVLSFLRPEEQAKLISEFGENSKAKSLLILGANEALNSPEWIPVQQGALTAYIKQ